MKEVIKLDTVDQYNQFFGLETLHPLVSVVDLSEATKFPTHFTMNYGIYALFLKKVKCGDIRYGRQIYDYQEGTVTSFAPGQVVETEMQQGVKPSAHGLLFHPDLIKGTSLGQDIKQYSFFSYASAEALHLSEEEKGIFMDCLEKIEQAQQTSDFAEHRTAAGLLHALLRKAVHHPFGKQQERAGEIRSLARRLFPKRQTANGRAAFRKILRRQSIPVTQLFRRSDKERNRKKRAGIHSDQNDRFSQRDDCRDGKDGQPDCL